MISEKDGRRSTTSNINESESREGKKKKKRKKKEYLKSQIISKGTSSNADEDNVSLELFLLASLRGLNRNKVVPLALFHSKNLGAQLEFDSLFAQDPLEGFASWVKKHKLKPRRFVAREGKGFAREGRRKKKGEEDIYATCPSIPAPPIESRYSTTVTSAPRRLQTDPCEQGWRWLISFAHFDQQFQEEKKRWIVVKMKPVPDR